MSSARSPVPTWFFVVVVVRKGDRFALVHELKHGQLWYLPAGRVEPGENFYQAALRETEEETGLVVKLDGVIRVEHTPGAGGTMRVRVIFTAQPVDDRPPRSEPNSESLGAVWTTLAELDRYPLRGPDVRELFEYVARGGRVSPLAVVAFEADRLA
ncbi:MAG: NUDIX domain-containing protein [Polyangiaceae bacterium]